MLVLSAVLVAVVSNLDNLAVAVAFGIRGKRIRSAANVIIAAVTMAATAAALGSGRALARLLAPSAASVLGAAIIIAVGAITIVTSLGTVRNPDREPVAAHARAGGGQPSRDTISWRQALALGIALALNNVGAGVGAGVVGVPIGVTTMLAGTFSLICVVGGFRLGSAAGRALAGRHASMVSGLLLIAVGAAALSAGR